MDRWERLRAQWRWWGGAGVVVVILTTLAVLTLDDSADVGPLAADVAARVEGPGADGFAGGSGAPGATSPTTDTGVVSAEGSAAEISADAISPTAPASRDETSAIASDDGSRTRRDLDQRDAAPIREAPVEAESSPSTGLTPPPDPTALTPANPDADATPASSATSTSTPRPSVSLPVGAPRVPDDPVTSVGPPPVVSDPVLGALASLVVRDESPRSGYARELFPHWNDPDGNGCDARQDVLSSQVLGLAQRDLVDACVIVEGDWWSIYDDVTHAGSPAELDVDHIVSLAEAWDSGAGGWSATRRRAFANDPLNLVAVTASSNRSKSDRDLGEWRPPERDAWCFTARTTVQVKARYDLSVDAREAGALAEMLSTCTASSPDPRSTVPGGSTPVAAPSVPSSSAPSSSVAPPVTSPPPPTPTTVPVAPVTTVVASCVDINTASAAELERIVHIGASRAQQILELRPFATVDDLVRVSGIGASRLADILDQGLACVGS